MQTALVSFDEIAVELGLTVIEVKTLYQSGMHKLKRVMRDYPEVASPLRASLQEEPALGFYGIHYREVYRLSLYGGFPSNASPSGEEPDAQG